MQVVERFQSLSQLLQLSLPQVRFQWGWFWSVLHLGPDHLVHHWVMFGHCHMNPNLGPKHRKKGGNSIDMARSLIHIIINHSEFAQICVHDCHPHMQQTCFFRTFSYLIHRLWACSRLTPHFVWMNPANWGSAWKLFVVCSSVGIKRCACKQDTFRFLTDLGVQIYTSTCVLEMCRKKCNFDPSYSLCGSCSWPAEMTHTPYRLSACGWHTLNLWTWQCNAILCVAGNWNGSFVPPHLPNTSWDNSFTRRDP